MGVIRNLPTPEGHAPGPDRPRLRDLWPLLAGPLLLGGVVFWVAYFARIVRHFCGY